MTLIDGILDIIGRNKELVRIEKGVDAAKKSVEVWFSKREKKGRISKVHDWSHVHAVAKNARVIAEELARVKGLNRNETRYIGAMAEATGYFHDISREATEKTPHGPSGAIAVMMHSLLGSDATKHFTKKEINAISKIVKIHEADIGSLDKEFEKEKLPEDLKIIAKAVVWADKLFEASGHRVLERRSFFVGKERLEGDLKPLKERYGKNASLYAVSMESCMRLRAINTLSDYPKEMRPVAKPLHQVQERFYYGLLKYLSLNEDKLVQEMKVVKFPKFEQYANKIMANVRSADSAREIEALPQDVADSAAEIVHHFASSSSPSQAVNTFKPKGKQAAEWLKGIKDYREGSDKYLKSTRKILRDALST